MRLAILFAITFLPYHLAAQKTYIAYDQDVARAYDAITRLDTTSAYHIIDSLRSDSPDENLALLHLENYIDFFVSFIGERPEDLDDFSKRKRKRIDHIREAEIERPYSRWVEAEIQLQYALARIKHGQTIKAGWDINRAYKLLKKNQKLYPDFHLNKKSLSVIHSLIGSVKGVQRTLIRVFTALDGSQEQGVEEISSLYKDYDSDGLFHLEISVIRAMMALHVEKDRQICQQVIDNHLTDHFDKPLVAFIAASMQQQMNRHKQAKIILEQAINLEKNIAFDYLHLMLGKSYLCDLRPDAIDHIDYFIEHFDGLHYQKEALQKKAWYHLIMENDKEQYHHIMSQIPQTGKTLMGEDQAAQRETRDKTAPNKTLLKARLLCDGGHYDRAEEVLLSNSSQSNSIEYQYRLARIYHGQQQVEKALSHYQKVINQRSNSGRYYQCNAALQSAILLYNLGKMDGAQHMIKICLSIHPEQHKDGLHQKAHSWREKIETQLGN